MRSSHRNMRRALIATHGAESTRSAVAGHGHMGDEVLFFPRSSEWVLCSFDAALDGFCAQKRHHFDSRAKL